MNKLTRSVSIVSKNSRVSIGVRYQLGKPSKYHIRNLDLWRKPSLVVHKTKTLAKMLDMYGLLTHNFELNSKC